MQLFNKIKWVLGILLVFVLILATNLIDRQNFIIVRDALETIYADRLVAQDILFDLSASLHEKEISYLQSDLPQAIQKNQLLDARINELVSLFATTKLTPKEEIIFSHLSSNISKLGAAEKALQEGGPGQNFQAHLGQIRVYLDDLANIQLQEGQREVFESKRAISAADFFTQLEIFALIIMAIAIQIIVIYPSAKISQQ